MQRNFQIITSSKILGALLGLVIGGMYSIHIIMIGFCLLTLIQIYINKNVWYVYIMQIIGIMLISYTLTYFGLLINHITLLQMEPTLSKDSVLSSLDLNGASIGLYLLGWNLLILIGMEYYAYKKYIKK